MSETEFLCKAFERIDERVASVLDEHLDDVNADAYRSHRAFSTLFNLVSGGDADYDWPESGWHYASWYHARRVLTSLLPLWHAFERSKGSPLHIVDLGCGTGAVLWAANLLALHANKHGNLPRPERVTYAGLDGSPIMLEWAERLWASIQRDRQCVEDVRFDLNNWHDALPKSTQGAHLWISASYLLDSSDRDRFEEVSRRFTELVRRAAPSGIWIQSSARKTELVDAVCSPFNATPWELVSASVPDWIRDFACEQPLTVEAREKVDVIPEDRHGPVRVSVDGTETRVFVRGGARSADEHVFTDPYCPLRIYGSGSLTWSDEQREAIDAKPPLVISGPAGSGKSVVLVERLRRLLSVGEESNSLLPEEPRRILVVSFNRGMVVQLSKWLRKVVDVDSPVEWGNRITITFGDHSAEFVTFDKLVLRILRAADPRFFSRATNLDADFVEDSTKNKIDSFEDGRYVGTDIADPHFLREEFLRVYYGANKRSRDEYMAPRSREGRGHVPQVQGNRRILVWECLDLISKAIPKRGLGRLFEGRRLNLHQHLVVDGNDLPHGFSKWTHVLVEECQDFLPADFDILYRLTDDLNAIVVTGDTSQSIRNAASPDLPRPKPEGQTEDITKARLPAAVRTPYRIGMCLQRLSREIVNAHGNVKGHAAELESSVLEPRRDAIPGIRPIVACCDEPEQEIESCIEIISIFGHGPHDGDRGRRVTFLDTAGAGGNAAKEVANAVRRRLPRSGLAIDASTIDAETIDAIKGQERWAVFWKTSSGFRSTDTPLECAYTAMSRASFLLVILIGTATTVDARRVLGLLDRDHILFWSEESERRFDALVRQRADST